MHHSVRRLAVPAALVAVAVVAASLTGTGSTPLTPASARTPQNKAFLERFAPVAGAPWKESEEIRTARESVAQARLAPYGDLAQGQVSSSTSAYKALDAAPGAWTEVTTLPYDEDAPDYRDPSYSNSSGGAGLSAGRVTGLAAGNGVVFAGGANGGVFRKPLNSDGSGTWTPISDGIASLSTGDLVYDVKSDVLWLATGEANTGGTSYTGAGVYRLAGASKGGVFTDASRVGGPELESRSINQLKIDKDGRYVYAATTRGLWRHDATTATGAWTLVFDPNEGTPYSTDRPYDHMVNDVAIDPRTGQVLANAAWRNGADYNGFYLSKDGAAPYTLVNPSGAINPNNIGNTEFAYAADGSRLYAVIENPTLLQTGRQSGNSVLYGVFASRSGSVEGPWSLVADYRKLGNSGSALKPDAAGKGYGPGVQAWYNNFIEVDPANPEHVFVGLEEVFETTNGGSSWSTPGPYWNFGFPCWDISKPDGGCPSTTHSDQHSVAIAGGTLLVGNDGGVKSRPVDPAASREDQDGHAADWTPQSVGLGTLQYYSVGVGKDPNGKGYAVSGGLQDNGASLIRGGATTMVSPFGGDGGDIVVNPRNGCEILDEYVYLTLWVTKTCGQSKGEPGAVFDVSVPDVNPRFTAPFRAVRGSQNTVDGASERWVAGGNSVWSQPKAFGYTAQEAAADASRGWKPVAALGSTDRMTVGLDAVADTTAPTDPTKDVVYAAWCGGSNCNSGPSFTRGVRTNAGGAWGELDMTGLPRRYPNAVTVDEKADPSRRTFYLVFNGYNRRFVEGPGSGQDHVWKGVVTGPPNASGVVPVTWTNLSAGMPDLPATDVVRVGDQLVVGTDYGVVTRSLTAGAPWRRVGAVPGTPGALPLTTVFDLSVAPDGSLYAATHGRGLWKVPLSSFAGSTTTTTTTTAPPKKR